jgi:hypothetical protein
MYLALATGTLWSRRIGKPLSEAQTQELRIDHAGMVPSSIEQDLPMQGLRRLMALMYANNEQQMDPEASVSRHRTPNPFHQQDINKRFRLHFVSLDSQETSRQVEVDDQ